MTQSKSFLKTQQLSRTVDTSNNSTILFLKNLETSTPQTTPQKNSNKNLFRKNHHPPKKSPQHTHTHIEDVFSIGTLFLLANARGKQKPAEPFMAVSLPEPLNEAHRINQWRHGGFAKSRAETSPLMFPTS